MSEKRDNVAVKFLFVWGSYSKGEIAGFPAKKAEQLIDKKIAEKYTATKK